MVDVAHRPHVQMGLVPIELLLGHDLLSLWEPLVVVDGPGYSPRTRLTISSWTDAGVCW